MHFDTLKSQLICWRDVSSIRIEEAFINNIADLEEQIQLVSNTDVLMQVKSHLDNDTKPDPKALQSQYLDPLVHRWVQQHIEPVLGQIQMDAEQLIRTVQMSSVNIETVDGIDPNKVFLANKATAMSAILMGGAYFGVQQVTRSALFGLITTTSTVISWPVLLVGLGLFIWKGSQKIQPDKFTQKMEKEFIKAQRKGLLEGSSSSKYQIQKELHNICEKMLKELNSGGEL